MEEPLPSASVPAEAPAPPVTAPAPERRGLWPGRRALRLATAIAVLGALGNWHLTLRERQLQSETQLGTARARLAEAEAKVREAEHVRLPLTTLVAQPRRIEDERQQPDWTPALRALALAVLPGMELGRVQAHSETANPGCSALRLEGVVANRDVAERFRKALEANLQKNFTERAVTTRFDRLEDVKAGRGTAPGAARSCLFAITATVTVPSGRLADVAPPVRR